MSLKPRKVSSFNPAGITCQRDTETGLRMGNVQVIGDLTEKVSAESEAGKPN